MITLRNETLAFFREMEYNIKHKIAVAREEEEQAKLMGYYYLDDLDEKGGEPLLFMDEKDERDVQRVRFNSYSSVDGKSGRSRLNSFSNGPPRRIRTISTMDGK
jgi:hypothetical protein